jgi:hypothetical protein
VVGEEEVLATELELMLVVESATDLDLSLFTFCGNFGSFEDECGVDGVGEELDGEWRDLLEDIVSRLDYVPTRLCSSLSFVGVQSGRGFCLPPKVLQSRCRRRRRR